MLLCLVSLACRESERRVAVEICGSEIWMLLAAMQIYGCVDVSDRQRVKGVLRSRCAVDEIWMMMLGRRYMAVVEVCKIAICSWYL
jgi:hypothetical protein